MLSYCMLPSCPNSLVGCIANATLKPE